MEKTKKVINELLYRIQKASDEKANYVIETDDIKALSGAQTELKNHGVSHNVIVPKGTFCCFGGNHAKGIKPCKEWCGEVMCQKPSN